MITLIVFVLILSFLVFIHELGHFMAARKSGVRVEEFGLGIPPRIWGKKFGETLYSLNLLPFGGFVKLTGEDDDSQESVKKAMADPENFLSKSPATRALILVAGILMNIFGAFILYYVILGMNGFKSQMIPMYVPEFGFKFGEQRVLQTVISAVEPGSPAEKAGVKFGEAVIEINDKPVYTTKEVREEFNALTGQQVKVLLLDVKDSSLPTRVVTVTPELMEDKLPVLDSAKDKAAGSVDTGIPTEGSGSEKGSNGEQPEKRGKIGVVLGPVTQINYSSVAALAGPMHAFNMLDYTFVVFGKLLSFSVQERTIEPVSTGISGPVGVFAIVGEILKHGGKDMVMSLLDLVALLSLSLGVMNLLPIPALDGGRLMFVIYEMVTGHRPNPAKEALVHKIGMIVLLGLMVLVTFKDIRNFF